MSGGAEVSRSAIAESRRHMLHGALITGGLQAVYLPLTIGLSITLARLLGPEGYGSYSVAYALVLMMGVPARMGLPALIVRETARYQLRREWGLLRGLLACSNRVVALTSGSVLVVGSAICLARDDASDRAGTTLLAFVLVPIVAFSDVRVATLRGLRRIGSAQIPEMLVRPALALLSIAVLSQVARVTPQAAMAIQVGAATSAFLVGAVLLRRQLPDEVRAAVVQLDTAAWRASLIPLTLMATMTLVSSQIDTVLLGALGSEVEAGLYRVALQGSTLVATVLVMANAVAAPQAARLFAAKDLVSLQRLVTVNARAVLALSLPLALVLIAFGPWVIGLVFGQEYRSASLPLKILCAGQIINAGTGSVGLLLNMSGNEHVTARALVVSTTINVVLDLALIPTLGATGAALASATGLTVWNVFLYRRIFDLVGVHPSAFHSLVRAQPERPA